MPTHENILRGMKWLVADAEHGDSLFLHYSGHGTQIEDTSGDEVDGYDEALVPLDYKESGLVLDDDVYDILARALPDGCRLTILLDCCHSGTGCDLPYKFKAGGADTVDWKVRIPHMVLNQNWDFKNFSSLMKQGSELGLKLWQSYKNSENATKRQEMGGGEGGEWESPEVRFLREGAKNTLGEVVMFSGCKDSQTSADVSDVSSVELPEDAGPGGAGEACTSAFLATLNEAGRDVSYIELLDKMREVLSSKRFSQVPQLSSTRKIDLDQQLVLFG